MDTIDIIYTPPMVTPALEAFSVEISSAPRVGLFEIPSTGPSADILREQPLLIALESKRNDTGSDLVRRLRSTVEQLAQRRKASHLVELHTRSEFSTLITDLRMGEAAERSPVVLYLPSDKVSERDQLLEQSVGYMLKILTWLDTASSVSSNDSSSRSDTRTAETALERARQRRAELLADRDLWFDAGEVHEQQKPNAKPRRTSDSTNKNTASRLRRSGELLGAWSGREYLYPRAQFHPQTGLLMPEVKDLIEILPEDPTGWRQALWLYQPHARLGGKTPADVLPRRPQEVIEAARSTFQPGDTNW